MTYWYTEHDSKYNEEYKKLLEEFYNSDWNADIYTYPNNIKESVKKIINT